MPLVRRLLVCGAVFLGACESSQGLPGVWTGTVTNGTSFNLTITETLQGVVSGAGRINNTLTVFPVTVTGAHAHPAVTLAITAQGLAPTNFSGTLDATLSRMDGVLYGSGFVGDSLHLVRITPAITAQLTAP